MATPTLEYRIRSKDESKAGIDSAKANAEGLTGKMKDLSQGMDGVNKLAATMMGAGALAGVTMALRKVYQGAAECEAAFAKLHPEIANVNGGVNNFAAAIDTLQASVGGLVDKAISPARAELLRFAEDLKEHAGGDWMEKIASGLGRGVQAIVKVAEFLGTQLWMGIFDAFGGMMKLLLSATAAVGKLIWAPLKAGFEWMIFGIKVAFQEVVNWMITAGEWALQTLGKGLQSVTLGIAGKGLAETKFGRLDIGAQAPTDINILADWSATLEALKNDAVSVGSKLAEDGKILLGIFTDWSTDTKTYVKDAAKETKDAAKATIAAAKEPPWEVGFGGGGGAMYPPAMEASIAANSSFADFWRPYGELFKAEVIDPIAEAIKGGSGVDLAARYDPLAKMFGDLKARIEPFIKSLSTVKVIMEPLNVILGAMVATLQPAIDSLLTPLIGILSILGQTLGKILLPVLDALAPVVRALGEIFVWLYNNIIAPVGAVIWAMFQSLANSLKNFVTGMENFFAGKGLVWGTDKTSFTYEEALAGSGFTPIEYQDLETTGTQYVAGAGGTTSVSGGGTPTYHSQTINIQVDAQGAYISDLRDFALLIRDEIAAAEAISN